MSFHILMLPDIPPTLLPLTLCSNCSDTDVTVKISDVYPALRGDASVLLGDSIMRMRWRDGVYVPPRNMTPGKVN